MACVLPCTGMIALAATLLALQSVPIALESPQGENDGLYGDSVLMTPDGLRLIAAHSSGGPATLIATDGSGVTGEIELLFGTSNAQVTPDGAFVVSCKGFFDELSVSSLATTMPVGTIDLAIGSAGRLILDSTGQTAITFDYCAATRISVVDIPSLTVTRVFDTLGGSASCARRWALAADDRTLVGFGLRWIRTYDIQTGLLVSDLTLAGAQESSAKSLVVSADRTRAFALLHRQQADQRELSVEVFDLPSLTPIATARAGFGRFAYSEGTIGSTDRTGTRLAFESSEGTWLFDMATQVTRQLTDRPADDVTLTADGAFAVVIQEHQAIVFDARTGTEVDRQPILERLRPVLKVGVHDRSFYLAGSTRDRIEMIELDAAGGLTIRDLGTGGGDDVDGPHEARFIHDGNQVAITCRDSDEVLIVDLESDAITARIPGPREPIDLDVLSSGRLAVAHRSSAIATVVDPISGAQVGSIALQGLPHQIHAVPGTERAWVYVASGGVHALTLIDAATQQVMAEVDLPGAGSGVNLPLFAALEHVIFDDARQRAFVVDERRQQICMIDLASRTIVDVQPLRPTNAPAAAVEFALNTAGTQIIAQSQRRRWVQAFDVQASGLTATWTRGAPVISPVTPTPGSLLFALDDTRVWIGFDEDGRAPGSQYLDAITGVSLDQEMPTRFEGAASFQGGHEIIAGRRALQLRSQPALAVPHDFGSSRDGSGPAPPMRSDDSRRTVRLESRTLRELDLIGQDASVFCSPPVPNSTGQSAALTVLGSGFAGDPLRVDVSGLQPGGMVGYLLVGSGALSGGMAVPGAIGQLCLDGDLARLITMTGPASASGRQRFDVDTTALPFPTGAVSVQVGNTFHLQSWYRDTLPSGLATSNFSSGMSVLFR